MYRSMEMEIFLVEELEKRLLNETVRYKKSFGIEWYNNTPDTSYFDSFISEELYTAFIQLIYDRIKPLNSHEANRFLTLSMAQFKTHSPAKRFEAFKKNYVNSIIHPGFYINSLHDFDLEFLKSIWHFYTAHFDIFKVATENSLSEFKAGLIGSQPSPVKTNDINTKNITYNHFDEFIKLINFNMEDLYGPILFKEKIEKKVIILKQEILENLINLSKDDRKPYLKRLEYIIQCNDINRTRNQETVDFWLEHYNIKSEDHIYNYGLGQPLCDLLRLEYKEDTKDEIVKHDVEMFDMKFAFYDVFNARSIDDMLKFISEQINEHSPYPIQNTPSQSNITADSSAKPKLKTNLTVPQLAYLFKMLMDINPPIFDTKTKKEVYEFIEANFTTKGKEDSGPTVAKLNNLYSDVDKATAMFWATKLKKMLEDARKI